MNKILARFAALAACAQALCAGAAVIQVPGTLDAYTAGSPFQQLAQTNSTSPGLTPVSDSFEFSLTVPALVNLVVQSYSGYSFGGSSPFDVGNLSLSVYDASHSFLGQAGFTDRYTQTYLGALQAGSYFADVTGTFSNQAFGQYRATFSAAPVPEPGTLALVGAGILALAARARRSRAGA